MPEKGKFPSVSVIYDKFSPFEEEKAISQSTPKKQSSKVEAIDVDFNSSSKEIEEDKFSSELGLSDTKIGKLTKNERHMKKAQMDIENKIDEANNLVVKTKKQGKREGSGNVKRNKNHSPQIKNLNASYSGEDEVEMHQNPHMMKERVREGEDKRAISTGRGNAGSANWDKNDRQHYYWMPPQSPSARQPTTAEKYTLFGHSEDSTL